MPDCIQENPDGRRNLCDLHDDPDGVPFWEQSGPLDTPCHIFAGATADTGYGRLNRDGKATTAHRDAGEIAHGPTTGLVLHRCDIPNCCNVEHLYVGSFADNSRDRHERTGSAVKHHPDWKLSHLRQLPLAVLVDMAERYDGPHDISHCRRK